MMSRARSWLTGRRPRAVKWDGYAIATIVTVLSNIVGAFSLGHDVTWRMGAPHNLWEPSLWEASSGIVVLALLPLPRTGALLLRAPRLPAAAPVLAALAVTYALLHIIGMGFVREAAYRIAGWPFTFPWSNEFIYELRKDLFSYGVFTVIFWLAERRAGRATALPQPEAVVASTTAADPEFWIRDGRTSILVDPRRIVMVASAGNYIEYVMSDSKTHLVRATLQAQEDQLTAFGIARVHRSRLVNLKRVVAVDWRASGDFELRLDSGETVAGSRRFKAAVAEFVGQPQTDHV